MKRAQPTMLILLPLTILLVLSGCGVRMGIYKAPRYELYRPQGTNEQVVIHVERTPPLQWITTSAGQVIQGMPVVIELSAEDTTLSWVALADRFVAYEIGDTRDGQVERTDTFTVFPVTAIDRQENGEITTSTDSLSSHPGVLSGDTTLIRSSGRNALQQMADLNLRGAQTLLLVCPGTDRRPRCFTPGKAYELHIRRPMPTGVREKEAVRNSAVVYPFRLENRSIPVTILMGVALLLGFLQWATG